MKTMMSLCLLVTLLALPVGVYAQDKGAASGPAPAAQSAGGMNCPMMAANMGQMQKDMDGMMKEMSSMMSAMTDPTMKERMQKLQERMKLCMKNMSAGMGGMMGQGMMKGK